MKPGGCMKKIFLIFSGINFCFFLFGTGNIHAAEALSSAADAKQEIISDRQQIKQEIVESKDDAQAAKTEERLLKEKIKAALDSEDWDTASRLKQQLMSMHQENVQEKIQDKQEIRDDAQELRSDMQEARQAGYVPAKIDKDNNPPGPKGGPGTNWENPPGPKGGPGASPHSRVNR
jgi:hypothetical protein